MGGQASGALNASGFSASIKANRLPAFQHITHNGIFNETFFQVGDKAKELLEIHSGVGISNCDLYDLPKRNYFVSLFLKCNVDGQKRTRPINVIVCLDVSGSMGGFLNYDQQSAELDPAKRMNRLDLSRKAILMLYNKLQDDDVFTLVTFHNTAKTIIKSNFKKNLSNQAVQKSIFSQFQSGGTTLKTGFEESLKNFREFTTENTLGPDYEHRIVMLTDVGDNSVQNENKLITQISENQRINTTIIGVSSDFRSSTCEKLVQCKGFNYFCAVQDSDLQTYLCDRFDYNFFPCVQNTEITVSSDIISEIETFGTVDSQVQYKKVGNTFVVTKMKSGFPSELQINKQGKVQTQGGLILVKLKLNNEGELPHLKLDIGLKYEDMTGKKFNTTYQIDNKLQVQQYYSDSAVQKGVRLFYYTQTMRNLLKDMNQVEGPKRLSDENKGLYVEKLNKLKELCPKSKQEELQKVIQIVQATSQKKPDAKLM